PPPATRRRWPPVRARPPFAPRRGAWSIGGGPRGSPQQTSRLEEPDRAGQRRDGSPAASGLGELPETGAELGLRAQRGAETRGQLEQLHLDLVGLAAQRAQRLLDGGDLGVEVRLVDSQGLPQLVELTFDEAQLLVLVRRVLLASQLGAPHAP